ncbi:MAG: hypothetical protein RI973_1545 [Bacteroidota bacterium]|jgi:hypothetical protein
MKKLSLLLLLFIPLFSRAQQLGELMNMLLEKMPDEVRQSLPPDRLNNRPFPELRRKHSIQANDLLKVSPNKQPGWRGEEEIYVLDSFYTYEIDPLTNEQVPVSRFFNTHNEQALLITQVHQYYDHESNSWENELYLAFEYDSLGRELVRIARRWSSYFGDWQNQQQTLTHYNDKGHPIEKIGSWWHFPTSTWQESERTQFVYGHMDRLIQQVVQIRENSSWKNQQRHLFSYSIQGDTLEVLTQLAVQPDVWINNSRRSKGYDGSGNNFEHLYEFWDPDHGWTPSSRETYSYNQQHQVTELILRYWSPWQSQWINAMRRAYAYNGMDKASSIVQQYWDYEEDVWVNQDAYDLSYDADGNLKDAYHKYWWPVEFGLVPEYRYLIDYNDSGDTSELTYQVWRRHLAVWQNMFQISLRYDSAGHIKTMTAKSWDSETESWQFEARLVLTYVSPGLLSAIYEQSWNEDQQQWLNSARTLREYDTEGRVVLIALDYATEDQGWIHESRTFYDYNTSGQLAIVTMQYYQLAAASWHNVWRNIYHYNGGLMSEEFEEEWDQAANRWKSYYKTNYLYDSEDRLVEEMRQILDVEWRNLYRRLLWWDAAGNQVEEISQHWLTGTQAWQNNNRQTWEYDGDGLLSLYTDYYTDIEPGNDWRPVYKEEYHYDSLMLLTETHSFSFVNQDYWELITVHYYAYNSAEQATEVVTKHRAPLAWDWKNHGQHLYFWSKMLINTREEVSAAGLDCFLQNPYPGNGPVRCEGLEGGREYELLLFNEGGMLLSARRFVNGMSLGETAGFSPGIYWMILRTGGKTVHAGKVVMGL